MKKLAIFYSFLCVSQVRLRNHFSLAELIKEVVDTIPSSPTESIGDMEIHPHTMHELFRLAD